ncbi:hypothetical protein P9222_32700 [Paenibacillus amylolyticus]|nr:hypothetical protein [Paenibacillus amylolyticus]WFR62812.1 hypothetical protein P9222_32700 [Paenibacillus amylolyticus]
MSYIHVESLLELRRIIAIAKEREKQQVQEVRILLRINLRSSTLPRTKIVMGGAKSFWHR